MDLAALWLEAIQRVVKATPDEQDRQIMNLFQTQVSLSLSYDSSMIRFLCSSTYICTLFCRYSVQFYSEVCHLLNKQDLGFAVQVGSIPSSLPDPSLPPDDLSAYGGSPDVPGGGAGQAAPPAQLSDQGQYAGGDYGQQSADGGYQQPEVGRRGSRRHDAVNPNKTFENYVTDPDNRLLVTTAEAVAANPGTSNYNPFYIHGGSGLGKTHLLFAIANRIRRDNPSCDVFYIRAEEFIRHYVESMSRGRQSSFSDQSLHFRDFYTKKNVFIVDDIQNFTKSPKTRDAFFEIIAEFIDRPNRQLILASDVSPGNLKDFSARLISRFGSGVCCEVFPPSAETRTAIVISKCREIGLPLSEKIISYVATNIRSNVREIEGALKTLYSQYRVDRTLSYETAVEILSNMVNAPNQVVTMDTIKERVAMDFEITVASMESAARKRVVSQARSIAMALIRELIPASTYKEIGSAFNKDHTSVIEAIQRIERRIVSDKELGARYERLKLSLKTE